MDLSLTCCKYITLWRTSHVTEVVRIEDGPFNHSYNLGCRVMQLISIMQMKFAFSCNQSVKRTIDSMEWVL